MIRQENWAFNPVSVTCHSLLFNRRTIYVNIFTGEAATKFPQATQMARGGVSFVSFQAINF
jgi:hypothetical protein